MIQIAKVIKISVLKVELIFADGKNEAK